MWIVTVIYRFKYYFAWAVSESALIFSGFCFNGWDEKGDARWDRYCNTRISQVEFGTSAAELPAHWNTCTGNFLRRCEPLIHVCFPGIWWHTREVTSMPCCYIKSICTAAVGRDHT